MPAPAPRPTRVDFDRRPHRIKFSRRMADVDEGTKKVAHVALYLAFLAGFSIFSRQSGSRQSAPSACSLLWYACSRAIGLQVLVIDEVHNILAGTARGQRIVLNTLTTFLQASS